jgi:hypothetical protein
VATLIGAIALLTVASSVPTLDEGVTEPTPIAEDETTTETPPAVYEEPYGVWDRLAACESTSNWRANTRNGYYGGVQMDMAFWRNHGGMAIASRPDLASRTDQIAVAKRGQRVQGWGAWPVCSRRLGLR